MAEKDINMEIKLTIPIQFETHFNMDSFKDSLKRIAFDIKEHIKLKDTNPDVIPLSGRYERELADALPEMFENAEIDYSEHEISELRQGVKSRLNTAYPWTEPLELSYSHAYGEESMFILVENPVAQRKCLVVENLNDHTYKVEKEPGKDHTLIDATPETMEKTRQYLMNQQQKE